MTDQIPQSVDTREFARLIGASRKTARAAMRRCHTGGQWRDHPLKVFQIRGRGGRSGVKYVTAIDSLPPELQAKWQARHGDRPADGPGRHHLRRRRQERRHRRLDAGRRARDLAQALAAGRRARGQDLLHPGSCGLDHITAEPLIKDAGEARLYDVPFAGLLPAGQTIASVDGVAQTRRNLVGGSVDLTLGPPQFDATNVHILISGGTGGEFNKLGFVDDALRLSGLTVAFLNDSPEVRRLAERARRSTIVRAEPYNAPAKPVEGAFAVLERGPFAMLPGWNGGNRMLKKTANLGRAPEVFSGDEAAFGRDLRAALDYYETQPQSGHLDGQSPRAAFAAAVAAGWKRIDVHRDTLMAAFATEALRTVRQGEIKIGGRFYRHDVFLSLRPRAKVPRRLPVAGERDRIAVLDEHGALRCMVEPSPIYDVFDPAGAKDKARRRAAQSRVISVMRREVDAVDPVAEMAAAAELHPPAPVPDSGGVIRLADHLHKIGAASGDLPATQDAKTTARLEQRAARQAYLARTRRSRNEAS